MKLKARSEKSIDLLKTQSLREPVESYRNQKEPTGLYENLQELIKS